VERIQPVVSQAAGASALRIASGHWVRGDRAVRGSHRAAGGEERSAVLGQHEPSAGVYPLQQREERQGDPRQGQCT